MINYYSDHHYSNPYKSPNIGWECSKCGTIYSPIILRCSKYSPNQHITETTRTSALAQNGPGSQKAKSV